MAENGFFNQLGNKLKDTVGDVAEKAKDAIESKLGK